MNSMVTVSAPIVTERLVLRPLAETDRADVYAYQSSPEVVEYLLWELRDPEQSFERLRSRTTLTSLVNDDDILVLAAVLPGAPSLSGSGDRVIGDLTVILRSVTNRHAELGWVFHPDFQGHGYATEAAERMLDFAFTELNCHRVSADLDPRNHRSAALATRLGMRQEALFREDLFIKGAFADTATFAILRSEWDVRRIAADA
jgi:RimJ/RimL family protein N-acetyltransferase